MKKKPLRRTSAAQWASFADQAGALLRCGVPLREALQLLSRYSGFPRSAIQRILFYLERGHSFSQSLEKAGFTPLFVSLIRAAESYGGYVQALRELARYYRQQAHLSAHIRQASFYPLLVLGLSVVAFFFLLFIILPQFVLLYETMQVELPFWTTLLLRFGQWIQQRGIWLLLLLMGLAVAGIAVSRTGIGLPAQQKVLVRLPMVGRWLRLRNSHYLVQQLGLMLKNGVPLYAAWDTMTRHCPWSSLQHVLKDMLGTLERGQVFSQSLVHFRPFFDPLLPELLIIAEESGMLIDTLLLLQDRYEERIVHENQWLAKVFEPMLIIFVGGVMGLMMISLLVPMFHLAAG